MLKKIRKLLFGSIDDIGTLNCLNPATLSSGCRPGGRLSEPPPKTCFLMDMHKKIIIPSTTGVGSRVTRFKTL